MNIDADVAWRAVLERADGAFVYAVRSTGIYCRPTCPSRRPARAQVEFHLGAEQAEAAGFRACKRCRPNDAAGSAADAAVATAQQYLEQHADERVTLVRLAEVVGLSSAHLQRVFKQRVGLSPKAYQDAVRSDRFKDALRESGSVTAATYEAGYGSSSRAYERADLGMTPGEYAAGGRGVEIRFAIVDSALGRMLVAVGKRGLCSVAFADDDETLCRELAAEFPEAACALVDASELPVLQRVLELAQGRPATVDIAVDLHGTAFERRVWDAIRQIPRGETRTYGQLAEALGHPSAARAVARACASNRIALVVPCHRVVRADGTRGGYRWGAARKQMLVEAEE